MDVTSRQQSAETEGRLSLLTEQAVSKLLQSPLCLDIFQTPHEPKDQQLFYLKWKWKSLSPVRLCDPMECTVHEILQARILEWVAFPFSRGIFPNQGSNPGLPRYRWIIYLLRHKWSLRILEWGSYPFSSRSSWPWNQTRVSCIAGRFFTNWAMRESTVKKEIRSFIPKCLSKVWDMKRQGEPWFMHPGYLICPYEHWRLKLLP